MGSPGEPAGWLPPWLTSRLDGWLQHNCLEATVRRLAARSDQPTNQPHKHAPLVSLLCWVQVFDQTKGSATFPFRLGVGEVIKGARWLWGRDSSVECWLRYCMLLGKLGDAC